MGPRGLSSKYLCAYWNIDSQRHRAKQGKRALHVDRLPVICYRQLPAIVAFAHLRAP
jgi:hypothetical protein